MSEVARKAQMDQEPASELSEQDLETVAGGVAQADLALESNEFKRRHTPASHQLIPVDANNERLGMHKGREL